MLTYTIRRLIQAIPIMLGISILIFLIVQLAPGDPVDRFRTPQVRPEQLERLMTPLRPRQADPRAVRDWLTAFFQFPWNEAAWGYSFNTNQPVRDMIFERIPATVILMGTSLLVTILVSLPIGIIAAVKQYSLADKLISGFATIGYAMPSFLIGIYVLMFGGVILRQWTGFGFPLFGRQTLGGDGNALDIAYHLFLPVLSLSIQSIAASRGTCALDAGRPAPGLCPHGEGEGVARRRVIYKHALRNALIPFITLIGLSFPSLVAGGVITEFIFSYPGLGQLTINAIGANDFRSSMRPACSPGSP